MKNRVLKIGLCILAIVFLLFLAKFIYRLNFYHKLDKAAQKVYDSGNYSCYYYNRGERFNEENGEWIVSYSKMGLEVKGDKIAFVSYSGEDEDYALLSKSYYDKNETKDCIHVDFSDGTFQIQPNIMPVEMRERILNYIDTNPSFFRYFVYGNLHELTTKEDIVYFFENLKYFVLDVIRFKVDTVVENGQEYYVFNQGYDAYVNKDTLLVEILKIKKDGADNVVNSRYEIYTGNVTDEDVNPPDLTNLRQDIW